MNGINRVTLIGNLGKTPELKVTEKGVKYMRCTMATNEHFTNRAGEKITRTEWHNFTLWRGLAENGALLLKKGSLIYLEGKLRTSTVPDKDGNNRYFTEVDGENFTLLNRSERDGQNGEASYEAHLEVVADVHSGEDLPF